MQVFFHFFTDFVTEKYDLQKGTERRLHRGRKGQLRSAEAGSFFALRGEECNFLSKRFFYTHKINPSRKEKGKFGSRPEASENHGIAKKNLNCGSTKSDDSPPQKTENQLVFLSLFQKNTKRDPFPRISVEKADG
jgi:hypothetical protein